MNSSTFNDMPFLSPDDHILHQDSLVPFDGTTYWSEMQPQGERQLHQHHQALLDPSFFDPETVMSAGEALMKLSEQDLHIEPSLRSLNVGDTANYPSNHLLPGELDFPSNIHSQASGSGSSNTRNEQQHLPPREPFDGAKIRLWTEQFLMAKTIAHRWPTMVSQRSDIADENRTSVSVPVSDHNGSSPRKASAVSSTAGRAKQPASKVLQ